MEERFEFTCSCGAKYEIVGVHVPVRDKDMIECEFCHKIFLRWNGSTMYTARLISKEISPEDEEFLSRIKET